MPHSGPYRKTRRSIRSRNSIPKKAYLYTRGDEMRFLHFVVIGIATFNFGDQAYSKSRQTSGIYETSSDYQNGQLNFAGSCGSKVHRIELHNELHRP